MTINRLITPFPNLLTAALICRHVNCCYIFCIKIKQCIETKKYINKPRLLHMCVNN